MDCLLVSEMSFDESSSEASSTMSILQLKNSMTYWWNSMTFPWPQSFFMTFPGWKISFSNFKTFHNFPGCVGTLLPVTKTAAPD